MTEADYTTAVMADTPWGYWKLNETSGTSMVDSSGGAHGGTYAAAVVSVPGPFTGWLAARFTSSGASVVGVRAQTTPMAFEWWDTLVSASGAQCAFAYGDSGRTQGISTGAYGIASCGINFALSAEGGSFPWVCSAHPGFRAGLWTHCVLQLESDGHWYLYGRSPGDSSHWKDDVTSGTMPAVTSPTLFIANRPGMAAQLNGDLSHFAFYDHALTSTRIEAHWSAAVAAGPPPPPCPYGTMVKPGQPSAVEVTDAFLQSLLLLFPGTGWLTFMQSLLGIHLSSGEVCAQLPATLQPFDWHDLLTIGWRAKAQLEIMAWWVLCDCVPGSGTVAPPTPPVVVIQPGAPGAEVITVNPTNPCLDLTEVRRMLRELVRMVGSDLALDTFMQRQLAPIGAHRGDVHAALSGDGAIDIENALGVQIVITARPPGRVLEGAPQYLWDMGWASIMDGNGFIQERRITREIEVWMPRLFTDATIFGYSFKPGVVGTVTILYPLL